MVWSMPSLQSKSCKISLFSISVATYANLHKVYTIIFISLLYKSSTNRALKIDPRTEETWLIGPDFGFAKQKWFGGIFAEKNGCIYGIPHNANAVLKINPETDECTILGEGQLPAGEWKWYGGLANKD